MDIGQPQLLERRSSNDGRVTAESLLACSTVEPAVMPGPGARQAAAFVVGWTARGLACRPAAGSPFLAIRPPAGSDDPMTGSLPRRR
jgi:hypothetical protein